MPTTIPWRTVSRLLSVALVLTCIHAVGVEVEGPPPDRKTVADEIHDISFLMLTVENKLRDDDVSRPVQNDSAEIIARMEKLIKDAEANDAHPLKRGRESMPDSKLTPHQGVRNPKDNTIYDDGTGDVWAKLPREQRSEIIQTYARDFPLRWQARIAAYFLSINAVEGLKPSTALPKK